MTETFDPTMTPTQACQWCNAPMTSTQGFCAACGRSRAVALNAQHPSAPAPHALVSAPHHPSVVVDPARGYVGFWMRFVAGLIDGLVLAIPGFLVGLVVPFVGGVVLGWLYFALMHSSARQATLGQSAMGIVITGDDGARIGFGKASGQYFATAISFIILCIGYFMIGWTQKKQGLHDMMAGTLHYYRAV